jgi:serralysin
MTYRSYAGSQGTYYTNELHGGPQSFMMLDIAALQHLYGADFETNAGDTVYRWTPGAGTTFVDGEAAITPGGNRILLTVWDGGGTDTYDLSAYSSALRIDLAPGASSLFSAVQQANLGGGSYASGNVYNALQYHGDARSLIENAIGGSGADRIAGNAAGNLLSGLAGDDELRGLGGADRIDGGNGADAVIGGLGNDTFIYASAVASNPAARDTLRAGDGAVAFERAGAGLGDRFDLSKLDANSLVSGVQDFVFGTATGIGRLWAVNSGTTTLIRGNTDADAAAEFELAIADAGVRANAYTAHDFIV